MLTLGSGLANAAVIVGQADNSITVDTGGNHHIIFLPPVAPVVTQGTTTVTVNGSGVATLDFSAFTTVPVNVDLGDVNQQPVATIGSYTLKLILTGAAVNNIIGGADGGTLKGNTSNDTFILTGGVYTINGSSVSTNNTIDASADSTFLLTAGTLSIDGVVSTFSYIETVNFIGGPGNNTFTISGFTGTVNLTGGAGINLFSFATLTGTSYIAADTGTDEVEVETAVQSTITITDTSVTYASGTVNIGAASSLSLTVSDTAGANFDVNGWTGATLALIGDGAVTAAIQTSLTHKTVTLMGSLISFPGEMPGPIISLVAIDTSTIADTNANADVTFAVVGNLAGNVTLTVDASDTVLAQAISAGTITLTNTSLTFGGSSRITSFNSIQKAALDGSLSGNTFDVTGWTNGSVTINGLGGNNTIVATGSGTITLTNTSLTFSGEPGITITLNSIQNATLNGSASGVTFNLNSWTAGNVTLNGNGANNTVDAQTGTSGKIDLASTSLTFSSEPGVVVTLNSIQNAAINGSSAGNTFDLMSWQQGGNVTFTGNSGSSGNANDYIFNPFSASAMVNATVSGGGTNNTVDISSFPNGTTVNVLDTNPQTIASYLTLTLGGVQSADQGSGAAAHVVSQPGAKSAQAPVLTNALRDISGNATALDDVATATPQDTGDSSVKAEDGSIFSLPEGNRDPRLSFDLTETDNQFLPHTGETMTAVETGGFTSFAADKPGGPYGTKSFAWTHSDNSDPKSSS